MITVQTKKPVALDSPDHIRPFGTALDNSKHAEFNRRLYDVVAPDRIRLLDLGCAGGGFVKSILADGAFAVGIEGSDYSKVRNRAEWATIPGNLFLADITERFNILDADRTPCHFNVITAWEFLEHLNLHGLRGAFNNVHWHATSDALFLGSISTIPDIQGGIRLHQTVKPREWWLRWFVDEGWTHRPDLEAHFADEWLRGPKSAQPVPCSFFFAMSLDAS